MPDPIPIDYYTDILCVWAWIAQPRVERLEQEFGDQIEIRHRYVDVFGAVEDKIDRAWSQKGGYEGFARHVVESAQSTGTPAVHTDIWNSVRPRTSTTAHIFLKAVEESHGADTGQDLALRVRQAFFSEARDIGQVSELRELANSIGLDGSQIDATLGNGSAIAALMQDYQAARSLGIRGSPSLVLDGGRQVLYGNVAYDVLRANVEGLLKVSGSEVSWC